MTKKNTQVTARKRVSKRTTLKKTKTQKDPKDNATPATKSASVKRDSSADNKKSGPVAFSIDDIEALVATRDDSFPKKTPKKTVKKKKTTVQKNAEIKEDPAEKRVLGAASLSDILGFNPAEQSSATTLEESSVPGKWKKYYKLLIELREELSEEISLHTSDTLQHHSDDHAGDRTLEDDAGTDAFDRDFALSLVSGEQEALNEIEEALLRIKKGTYGICEVTGQPISKERLTAVPFARYSVEGQIEFEKNNRRKIDRSSGGLFSDSTDAPKIASDSDDDD